MLSLAHPASIFRGESFLKIWQIFLSPSLAPSDFSKFRPGRNFECLVGMSKSQMAPKMDSRIFAVFWKKILLGKWMTRELTRASGVTKVIVFISELCFLLHMNPGKFHLRPAEILDVQPRFPAFGRNLEGSAGTSNVRPETRTFCQNLERSAGISSVGSPSLDL